MLPALILIAAYLLGSIPFGFLIVRASEGGDIRETGSGGTGATNVTRRAGKKAGALTLMLDALKGALAVLLARWFLSVNSDINWWVAAAAVLAVIGHIFPIWLGFRGGKGVATGVGVFLALAPVALIGSIIVFVLIVWATRYISLGSIVATAIFPVCVLAQSAYLKTLPRIAPIITAAIVGGALIIFMHRANIARLAAGTESKFK